MKEAPTVTVLVMVEAGSKYEHKEISGLSHFLEHMCFKGTTKRPNALAISRELEAIGSQYNAFTSEEYTGYYAKAASKHAGTILDVVSDLYLNPVFPEADIEKEKGVIIEEINMYRDLPHRHVQELFMKLLYGDQPVGWGVAGAKETVQKMTRNHFVEYRRKHYVAPATTIIVAGNFNEARMLSDIEKHFAHIGTSAKPRKVKTIDKQQAPAVLIEQRKTDQTHMIVGVRAFPVTSSDVPATRVLNAVLGAGMSSRLFQKLREEMGVGYYVGSSFDAYTDHGNVNVSIGCDVKRVEEVIVAILAELKRFKTELVGDDELNKTKEFIIGGMLLNLESSDSIADFYGYQEVMGKPLKSAAEIAADIRNVTAKDIQRIAKKIFVEKHLNLAAVGPMPNEAKVLKLLHF